MAVRFLVMKKINMAVVAGLVLTATVFMTDSASAQNKTPQAEAARDSVSVIDGLKLPENAQIYIDGKLSTKEQLGKLRKEDIASMNVTKNTSVERKVTKVTENGQELQEISESKDIIEIYTRQGIKAIEDARPDFKGSVESKVVRVSTESGKIVVTGADDSAEIFLDGARISREDMESLSLKDIEGIEVYSSASLAGGKQNSRTIIAIHSNRRLWW